MMPVTFGRGTAFGNRTTTGGSGGSPGNQTEDPTIAPIARPCSAIAAGRDRPRPEPGRTKASSNIAFPLFRGEPAGGSPLPGLGPVGADFCRTPSIMVHTFE